MPQEPQRDRSEVAAFLAALRIVETGDQRGDYRRMHGVVRGNRKLGAYGIAADDWPEMAAAAGLPGADWKDPRAQDVVAEATVDRLIGKYQDWRLVGVAWKAGEKVADMAAADPTILNHEKLGPVKDYASKIMSKASGELRLSGQGGGAKVAKPVLRKTVGEGGHPTDPAEPSPFQGDLSTLKPSNGGGQPASQAGEVLRRRLYAMRNRVRNAPERETEPVATEPEIN